MWKQLTRNYKNPLLALLDLMENAFDAAAAEREFCQKIVCSSNEDTIVTNHLDKKVSW
jgi:hypothetical protein